MPEHTASLWRHRDFRTLWIGVTISDFGSAITSLALPMTAVVMLQAGPAQMGVLGAASTMPALLLSLFVGVWVDRVRQRPLLIGADLGRAILIGAIPRSAVGGMLRMEYLYVVSFLASILTLVFDIASTSLLPHIVSRKQLVEGNSKLVLSDSVVSIAGPGVAGNLIDSNRSGSENLTLAIQSPHSIPCHHGNTACIPPRGVGTDPIRSASLYSGTGSACGGIGGHGAGVTRAQPRVTGAAQPNLAEFFTSPFERSATTRTSTPSSE